MQCADVMEAFGLSEDSLPAIGIQYTHNNADDKYALTAPNLTVEKVIEFIEEYFAGALHPIESEQKDEL